MLVMLGIDVLKRLYQKKGLLHSYQHSNHSHSFNNYETALKHEQEHRYLEKFPKRALFVGLMHGMAGSAALIVLTVKTINTPLEALLYIGLFGLGSMFGMTVLSFIIAIPLRYSSNELTGIYNSLHLLIAVFTLSIGCMMIYDFFSL
jgi:hypothetical protein